MKKQKKVIDSEKLAELLGGKIVASGIDPLASLGVYMDRKRKADQEFQMGGLVKILLTDSDSFLDQLMVVLEVFGLVTKDRIFSDNLLESRYKALLESLERVREALSSGQEKK